MSTVSCQFENALKLAANVENYTQLPMRRVFQSNYNEENAGLNARKPHLRQLTGSWC